MAAMLTIAVGVLVVARVTSDDPTAPEDRGAPDTSRGSDASRTTTTGSDRLLAGSEPPLDDPRPTVTGKQLAGIAFTDVAEEAGLASDQTDLELKADMSMSSAAAVADVDRDGDADIYVSRIALANSLYRNNGDGTFTDIAPAAGVARPGGDNGSGAAAFADIDGDGCVDLYVAGAGNRVDDDPGIPSDPGEAVLFVNDCSGRFRDETAARGVALPATTAGLGAQGHGVTFADYDHDGFLDLLVLHWDPAFLGGRAAQTAFESVPNPASICERAKAIRAAGSDRTPAAGPNRSRLFRNDGTGHFSDVTASVGLPLDRIAGFTGDFVDVDGDGWEDLAIAGDFCTSRLFRNDGGRRFVDITDASGVGTDENGMGSVIRDVNGDGHPDWLVTSISLRTASGKCGTRISNTGCSGNRLYLNRGDGTFADATDRAGVRDGWWGWGAAIEDFGDDGRLSVMQTNGYVGEDPPRDSFITDPMRLWVPISDGDRDEGSAGEPDVSKFSDGAQRAGLDATAVGHSLIPFDMDDDGDLDVFVGNLGGPPKLYRNDRPDTRHWLTVRLDDPTRPGNRDGIGARVVVTPVVGGTERADRPTHGWISTGGSYESQRLPELHVGLGRTNSTVERIEVWWPGDTAPQVVNDVTADRVVTIKRS